MKSLDHNNWASIRQLLDEGAGYVICKGFPVEGRDEADIAKDFEMLSSTIGTVTAHGASQKKIWRVTPRPLLDHEPTFSETASEAPLHTDNSWVPEPEKYFGLLAIQPAIDGGESILISVEKLLHEFAQTTAGPEVLRILTEETFPFAMPVVFCSEKERRDLAKEVVIASVIEWPMTFRFRYDVIQSGFALCPELATDEKKMAVEVFNNYLIHSADHIERIKLERGDVLFANNHAVLHARTNFSDPNRLLLRVRIADYLN